MGVEVTNWKPFVIIAVIFTAIAIFGSIVFTGWALAWFWWAWLTLLAFFVIEFLAIFRKGRRTGVLDTLTSHVQAMTKNQWIRDIAAGALIGFAVWFAFHLWI